MLSIRNFKQFEDGIIEVLLIVIAVITKHLEAKCQIFILMSNIEYQRKFSKERLEINMLRIVSYLSIRLCHLLTKRKGYKFAKMLKVPFHYLYYFNCILLISIWQGIV